MLKKEKQELLERLNQSGLLYEELTLSGREIIIHEATGHSARKIGEMSIAIEGDKGISEDVKNALFTLFIPLSACSAGDLPQTSEDFFWMKNDDIEEWTKKARAMNPQFFALLDLQEKRLNQYLSESELSKKKKSRSSSKARS